MKRTGRRRARKSRRSPTGTGVLREVASRLPDVEDVTTNRGVAFTVAGRLVVCAAIHKSAEPNSVVVRVGPEERARLLAAYPEALYLTDHYSKHPAVLARVGKLDREALRDILGAAWLFVTEKTVRVGRGTSRRKP